MEGWRNWAIMHTDTCFSCPRCVLENSWPNAFDVAAEWLDASTGDFVAQSTTLAKQQKQKASVWQQTALQPVLNCTDSKVSVSYCLFLSVSALKEQKWTKVNKRIKVVTSFLLNISESIRSLTKVGTNRPGSRLQPRFCSLQDLTVTVRIWALQRSVHICIWRITYRLLQYKSMHMSHQYSIEQRLWRLGHAKGFS